MNDSHTNAPWLAQLFATATTLESTSLAESEHAKLLSRVDEKYVLRAYEADSLIRALSDDYRALEIAGERWQPYSTHYFDTPTFGLFKAHHRGQTPRLKVRTRSYLATGVSFLEVKNRLPNGTTTKLRTPSDDAARVPDQQELGALLLSELPYYRVEYKLTNNYRRLTLVHRSQPERITIDAELSFRGANTAMALSDTVVVEVKQERNNHRSTSIRALRALRARSKSFSKYCVGAALLYPELPHNRFLVTLKEVLPHVTVVS